MKASVMKIDKNTIATLITNTNEKQDLSVPMGTAVTYLVKFEKGQKINVSLILVCMR